MKFIVTGIANIEITAEIEADSKEEAKSEFDSADFCPESTADITITSANQCGSDVEDVVWLAADKWEELSPLERAIILKENGVSDENALNICQRDYLIEIDEEWWEYFDGD